MESSRLGVIRTLLRRRRGAVATATKLGGLVLVSVAVGAPVATADPTSAPSSYSAAMPQLATISNGTTAAPWNLWQGDTGDALYWSTTTLTNGEPLGSSPGDLLPVYIPGGATVNGTDPNIAVVPGTKSGTDGDSDYPYSSGVVGTPGPLPGYCGTGDWSAETGHAASATSVSTQPNVTLPLAPEYFPHVVANSDGTLTGYFDYRPKDGNEAVLAATSSDGGKDWTFAGDALQQNQGYCPSADINDDGQGHPNVLSTGGNSNLYTLQRPAGDNVGVGLLVHNLTAAGATESNPLGNLANSQPVGVDPDSFDADSSAVTVAASGGAAVSLQVQSTGTSDSTEQLIPGGFLDLGQSGTIGTGDAAAAEVINCTGVTAGTPGTLTGCTTLGSASVTVNPGDLIEQVLGYVGASKSKFSGSATVIDAGPNTTTGDGGSAHLYVYPSTVTSQTTPGFTYPLSGSTINTNAPNRLYVAGTPIYCSQSNNNPTTQVEDCTTGSGSTKSYSAAVGSPITSDPIIPAGAQMTTGLDSPDGIVGELPKYPGAPTGSTIVMYTEKELAYFVAGETPNTGTFGTASSGAAFSIPFDSAAYISEDLASYLTQGTSGWGLSGPVTVNIGDNASSSSSNYQAFVPVTCTGLTDSAGDDGGNGAASLAPDAADELTGCTVPTQFEGDPYDSNSMIAAPGAALVPYSQLKLTGEGSSKSAKLFGNNEDYEVLRAAYTTDGVNFSDAGLANGGLISGASNGTADYTDITDPTATSNPPAGLNSYGPGRADATEMRWPGAAGTIIDYPDGTIGMFMSGAWAADGDSDAFNQIYYTSSTDGQHWSVPIDVVSTDYTFSALANLQTDPSAGLGISGYYSGRAYDPTVFQEPDGSLSMLFAGYSTPKPLVTTGTTLGTGASQWTVGADAPAAYRNILVTQLKAQPAAIQFNAPATGTYGGSDTLSATGGGPSTPVVFTAESPTVCSVNGTTVSYVGVGNCVIDASQAGDASFNAPADVEHTIAVGAAPLTITASSPTTTYGGTVPTITPNYSGLANGDQAPATTPTCTTAATSSSPAGSYDTTCSGAADPHYDITYADGSVIIGPAQLTITASDGSMVYGGSAKSTITPSYSGFVNGDGRGSLTTVPTCSITLAQSSSVGQYPGGSQCAGAADGNYTFTYVGGTVTVSPASATITAPSLTIPYGSPVPTLTPSYSGLVNGDKAASLTTAPKCVTTYALISQVGTYGTSCTGAVDQNYKFTYVTGEVTVVQATSTTTITVAPPFRLGPLILPTTAEITVGAAGATPTGLVEVFEDGHLIAIAPLVHGSAEILVPPSLWLFGPSTNQLTAVYLGDHNVAGSTSATVTFE